MSIVVPSDQGAWWDASGACFYCGDGRPKDGITVMWSGRNGVDVWLHIRCAERLGMHLIADSREADLKARRAYTCPHCGSGALWPTLAHDRRGTSICVDCGREVCPAC